MLGRGKINYSDLSVVAKLIAGETPNIILFDPYNKVIDDENELVIVDEVSLLILINLGGELERYKEFELSEFDFIIDFSCAIKKQVFDTYKMAGVKTPSGTLRFLIQREQKKTPFLAFIPVSHLRSKLGKLGLKLAFKLGLRKIVTTSFNILAKSNLSYLNKLRDFTYDNYAIFMGTPGYWRKPVIQLSSKGTISHYVKLAISAQGSKQIQKEIRHIKRIEVLALKFIETPVVEIGNESKIGLKSISPKRKKQIKKWESIHFKSIKELHLSTMQYKRLSNTDFYKTLLDQFEVLKNEVKVEMLPIWRLLIEIHNRIDPSDYCDTATAHGDFTPWNIMVNDSKLHVYDWEMSISNAPFLYDVFHFVYQSEALISRNNVPAIQERLNLVFKEKEMADFIAKYKLDTIKLHQLYLLYTVSNNLANMTLQEHLTADHHTLLKVWQDALMLIAHDVNDIGTKRVQFLNAFQYFLAPKKYAALKFFIADFKELPIASDLDLVIEKEEQENILFFARNYKGVIYSKVIKKSFMSVVKLHFEDGTFLSIDLIHDFVRKELVYLSAAEVLNNARIRNGVKRPILFHDIEYAQHFYTLNNSAIPLKYQKIFSAKLTKLRLTGLYMETLFRKYNWNQQDLLAAFAFSEEKRAKLKSYCQKKNHPKTFGIKFFSKIKRKWNYLKDLWVDLKSNKGFMLTFSGVDGAGKTTIIDEVKAKLEQQYRKKVVVLRHRPGILPILSSVKYGSVDKAEKAAGNRLPRQGTNQNKLTSFLRFAYYFTDYLLGQPYVYFKYILRGKVVIYDRYYFDFINDAKRSNIALSDRFLKPFFIFIYKPDFNFYLYNEPAVILQRKKELTAADIITLNEKYNALFLEFEQKKMGVYNRIKNDSKSDTITEIFNSIHKVA